MLGVTTQTFTITPNSVNMENIYVVIHISYEIGGEEADALVSTEVFTDLEKANKFFEKGLAVNPFLKTPSWFHHQTNRCASGTHERDGRKFRHRLFLVRKMANPDIDKFF